MTESNIPRSREKVSLNIDWREETSRDEEEKKLDRIAECDAVCEADDISNNPPPPKPRYGTQRIQPVTNFGWITVRDAEIKLLELRLKDYLEQDLGMQCSMPRCKMPTYYANLCEECAHEMVVDSMSKTCDYCQEDAPHVKEINFNTGPHDCCTNHDDCIKGLEETLNT